ncbi:hypothetical protein [Novosphingobium sp. Chol11]|uniref:hypothetical protein n=1 Tax=Novosphingobium sp. Chol11 TaxID=1385763 RepID=UPI0025CDB7F9|nr:hypothetical protein [Novosphingobium sp. Chol11]
MIAAYAYVLIGLLLAVSTLVWVIGQGDGVWPLRWDPGEIFAAVLGFVGIVCFMALFWPVAVAFWAWGMLESRGKVRRAGRDPAEVIGVVVGIIGIVGSVLLLWPVLLVLLVWNWLKRKDAEPVEEQFTVPEAGLIEQLSVAEIESRELVDDPLGGAPRLPFGHLNPVWRKLLESVTAESTIWSFSTLWDHRWGAQQVEGYVLKSGAVIGPHMITSQRRRPREPAEEPTSPKIGLIEALSGKR